MFGANAFGQAYYGQIGAASVGLSASALIAFATTTPTLSAPTPLAATAAFRIGSTTVFNAPAFATRAGITFKVAASLKAHHQGQATILLAGRDARARVAGLTIRDVLNDAPNSCTLTIDGVETPQCEQTLRVSVDTRLPVLLFNGAIQTVNLSYEGLPEQIAYPCTAIDDTARANRMRPFGTWTNLSATTVAQQLIAQFAPGFTTAHVQANLPPVSIILDGTEGMSGALKQITTQIGGYFYFEDGDLHLFLDEVTQAPDPIDGTPGRLLDDPPITIARDDSQLRTRQCGRGHGEELLADVAAGETILPVANVLAWFNQVNSGRRAIALSERLTYAGTQPGGGGSLVGPGASPVVAPSATAVQGAGLPTGVLRYAVTFVTASGETLIGPSAPITTGPVTSAPVADPTTAPGFGTPTIGPGVDAGGHSYAVTWITAAGETLNGPLNSMTAGAQPFPVNPPTTGPTVRITGSSDIAWNGHYHWRVTFVTAAGETTIGPNTDWTVVPANYVSIALDNIPVGPPGTTARRIWLNSTESASYNTAMTLGDNVTTTITIVSNADYNSKFFNATLPPSNTAGTYPVDYHVIPLVGLPVGPSGVTGKNVYRSAAGGGPLRLCAGMPLSNGTTTYTDTTADAALGRAAPASNTTAVTVNLNAATVTGIPLGPGTVIGRRLYRTTVNGAAFYLLGYIGDNTTTNAGVDTAPDGNLGGPPPISDSSGLVGIGVAGAVLPGTTTLLTSGAAPFAAAGGWALLSGNQLVRYTGISGNTLIGIPGSGVGALVTTVLYGTQVMPAPTLIGVAGLTIPLPKGTPVCIWVQRDDPGAQAEQKAIDTANGIVPADGIYEGPPLVDERRNEASMTALCDANLALYARPIVTVTYACRDVKTKSGKTIVIDLDAPAIHEELTIQEVTITEIDIAPGLLPRFSVTASSVRFSLDDILRRLLTSSDAQTG